MPNHARTDPAPPRRRRWAWGDVHREAVGDAVVPFAVFHTLLFAIAAFVNSYLLPLRTDGPSSADGPSMFWAPWDRFDSTFYLGIADRGYSADSGPDWAFYPLYPYVVRVLGLPFGGGHTAHLIIGLLVANLAATGAALVLYLLVRREWGRAVARRTALYLAVFPTGFFLSAPYADGIFLLLVVSTLLLTRQHHWLAAGAVGALAAATRPPGVLLTLVVLAELVCVVLADRRSGIRFTPKSLLAPVVGIAMVPVGLVTFIEMGRAITGDPLVTFHVNAEVWRRSLDAPWVSVGTAIRDSEWGNPENYLFGPLNLALVVVYLIAIAVMVRRLPPPFTVLTVALMVLSVSASTLQAMGRQVLPMVPALILLAIVTRSETSPRHQMLSVTFAAVSAVSLVLYVLLVPAIA